MELKLFGPKVWMDDETYALTFEEGVEPRLSNSKYFAQAKGLAYDENGAPDDELCYTFYQDVMREEDKALFAEHDFTNGITVLMPGLTGGECRKNSGHYHMLNEGHTSTYTEIYEVLVGEAAFVVQEAPNFGNKDEELKVESLTVILAKPGDKVLVPPFCAHCVCNIGEGPMAFGNLAAPSPLDYGPTNEKHGLGVYILKDEEGNVQYVPNPNYKNLPEIKVMQAVEAPELGADKTISIYDNYVNHPEKFEHLYEPEKYEEKIWSLIR